MKEKKMRFYQRRWFLYLWLIIFPPIGILLLWTEHETMKKVTKIVLTVVFTIWFIIFMATGNNNEKSNDDIKKEETQTEQTLEMVTEAEESIEESSTIEETTEVETIIEVETTEIIETEKEVEEAESMKETNAYGWSTSDYEEFSVALKMIADNYLTGYKLPLYNKWQFAKFDDKGRIFAMTNELTFKGDHEKHLVICVFMLVGEVGENGLHETVAWSYFATDEKVYFDDGSCDEIFDKLKALVQ